MKKIRVPFSVSNGGPLTLQLAVGGSAYVPHGFPMEGFELGNIEIRPVFGGGVYFNEGNFDFGFFGYTDGGYSEGKIGLSFRF